MLPKVETEDEHFTDHELEGEMDFVWAYGRDDESFYKEDELKYHSTSNRGSIPNVGK